MAAERYQTEAIALAERALARLHMNAADLVRKSGLDAGTVGDFLNGARWPQRATRSRIEEALDLELGVLQDVASGRTELEEVWPGDLAIEVDHGNADDLRFQRPAGLSDKAWEAIRARQEAYHRFLVEEVSKER